MKKIEWEKEFDRKFPDLNERGVVKAVIHQIIECQTAEYIFRINKQKEEIEKLHNKID